MSKKFTDDQLRQKLTPEQYHILREKGTEAPFTGALLHNDKSGMYTCAVCGSELFDSSTKFDSGSGWPSFYDAKPGAVKFHQDSSLDMERTEVMCAVCGSHLGHIFHDAPDQPTGDRLCINSAALDFKPQQ
ncbi:MAG TPA: peptide-methionine (R)-S-oxide reductase MsrB [Nevskiaceae bacterium]|nr:peptide-methionine (R)-S-oxide reductase MsrB [Nevskiaceae bacterium]